MGWLNRRQMRLNEKSVRFGNTHLGAERKTGSAGQTEYPYIAYRESNAAAWLELCSILSVVCGMGLLFVLPDSKKDSPAEILLFAAGMIVVNRLFAVLARLVNNAQVRKRIVNDTDYAYVFAYKYPAQAHVCAELNPAYAANPDAVPAEQIRQKLEQERNDSEKTRRIILAAGLGFLVLVLIAAILFFAWVIRETA